MNRKAWLFAAIAANVGVASQAFAAGFEKNILWGARAAGVGGIATPYITGSQSLYFNPAGLANDKPGHDVSFNISPTWSTFKGPINFQNEEATSKTDLATPFGLIYNGTIDDKFGFGIGGYVSGGSKVMYENVAMTGSPVTANVKTDLAITEIAAGVGYKVSDSLKLGAAYRAVMGSASFAFVNANAGSPASFTNIEVNDIKATNFTGFKLGAQYKVGQATLLGLTYRSETELKGDGNYGGQIVGQGTLSGKGEAKTVFPAQITLGARHDYETWVSMLEYSWTQYSRVGEIPVNGTVLLNGTTPVATGVALKTVWRDQHAVRVGGEYLALGMPIRAGYIWTSQVTNEDYARASFPPPGMGHTLTLGTGQSFTVMEKPLQLDAAGEYTMISGDGKGAAAGNPAATADTGREGKYAANAFALHLGVTYAF